MDEMDLYLALTKTAGPKEALLGFAKRYLSPEALAGAAILGTAAYLSSKPGKGGGPSKEQIESQKIQKALGKKKEDESFARGMIRAPAAAQKELADLFAKHPVKGALVAAPLGAEAGIGLTRLIKSLL